MNDSDYSPKRTIMSEQDLPLLTPAEVSCPKCGAGVPAAEELIDELVADVIHLIGECDVERAAGMNDWRQRALEYEAVIWKAYWECNGHFDSWLLDNLPDVHVRIQNAVKP